MSGFFDVLIKETEYSSAADSWSPAFSSVGVAAGEGMTGTGELWFHYNRKTRPVFGRFVSFDLPADTRRTDVSALCFGKNTRLVTAGTNAFVFESAELPETGLFACPSPETADFRPEDLGDGGGFFRGFSLTDEQRDPDAEVPFGIAVKIQRGVLCRRDGGYYVTAENGEIRFGVVISVLTVDKNGLCARAEEISRLSCDELIRCDREYWREIARAVPPAQNETEEKMLAGAVRALVFNTTHGEGDLSKHLSCYPSRGGYPCHFLWDTYFQNLGYAVFDKKAALDFLLQIAENCRADGKFPQFMCSTWSRPRDSQPPLFGWAVGNLTDGTQDKKTLETLYHALKRNNEWWLTSRLTPCGLIYSPSGLETGQDNAPRFDKGAAIPCDMNAYLLDQLRQTAALGALLGDTDGAKYHTALADGFSEKIYSHLYCREDGLFYDRDRNTGEFIRVRSNACVLPVWAGVKMPEAEKKRIFEEFLFDESAMFGEVPFPSVACDDPSYVSSDWWRGPTWMPIAYLLYEAAERNGYHKLALTAAKRLYRVIVRDGQFHELFDSRTGEGLGNTQQGWTSGIFIRLCSVLSAEKD